MPLERSTSAMPGSELRQDRTSGRWVIVAPERQARPGARAVRTRAGSGESRPRIDAACPFCPGNEARLPGIIDETPADAAPGWTVRVVPNKYPALDADPRDPADGHEGLRLNGFGFHEVIIESPFHDRDLDSLGDAELEAVVAAYRDRSRHLIARPGIETAILFRNHGPGGGASLEHPHAQIVALGLVPPNVALLADWGERYHADHGRCPTCDEIAAERARTLRVIDESQSYITIVPFAAEHAFETWVLPKQHQASFIELEDSRRRELGTIIRCALRKLRRALDDPACNLVIDSADRRRVGVPFMHWRLRIVPQLSMSGGFELGAGMTINPSSPERDAAILRAASCDD